jgi:hypothetical protein
MPKTEEGREEIIKDSMLKIIKGSEAIALQAVDSAAAVLKAGLTSAEDLGAKASDILLNATRRVINAGNVVGGDVCEATKSMVKGTMRAASEIGSELKETVSTAIERKASAGKSEEKAESE